MAVARLIQRQQMHLLSFKEDVGMITRDTRPDKVKADYSADLQRFDEIHREANIMGKWAKRNKVFSADGGHKVRADQDLLTKGARGEEIMLADCASQWQLGLPPASKMVEVGVDAQALRHNADFQYENFQIDEDADDVGEEFEYCDDEDGEGDAEQEGEEEEN